MTKSIPVVLGVALLLSAAPARAESPKERAQKLMKTLAKDKDPQKRASAAEDLGTMGAWDAVPALAAALEDPSADVRIAATYGLTRLKEHAKDAVPALKKVLADPNALVRYNAVVALQNLDAATPGELMPALAPLLADRDKEIRENVLKMLFNVGLEEKSVRDTLLGALELGPPEVRHEVAMAVDRANIDASDGPWVAEFTDRLMEVGAKEPDARVRRDVVMVLRDVRPPLSPGAARYLTRALDDPDLDVASAAAATLNGAEEDRTLAQKAVAHLVKQLQAGPGAREKVRAAKVLEGLIGYRETFIPALARALVSDKEAAVRVQAALTMGDLRGDEAIAPLLKALQSDPDRNVRAAAASGLAEFGSHGLARAGQLEAVLAALRAAVQDGPDDNLRVAAENALESIQK